MKTQTTDNLNEQQRAAVDSDAPKYNLQFLAVCGLIALALVRPQKADAQRSIYIQPQSCGIVCAGTTVEGLDACVSMQHQNELIFDQPSTEVWKPVAGYEGLYEVSNEGNVRSTGNVPGRWGAMPARPMVKTISGKRYKIPGQGYYQVHLTKGRKGKLLRVCRLVALAFVPNPNNYPQTDHIDGNPRNDKSGNLDWVTNQENQIRAVKNGQHKAVRGEDQPTHVLTKEQVVLIKQSNKTQRQIAKEFLISKTQVGRIQRCEAWGWL